METSAIERAMQVNTTISGSYCIWRREYQNPHPDSILKLIKDQIIMAKVYASIARSNKKGDLNVLLEESIRQSQSTITEAKSDAELHKGALEQVKSMAHAIITAKKQLYDCPVVARKLRSILQYTEKNIDALRRESSFLSQLASRTIPKSMHCLPLQLTSDYYLHDHASTELIDKRKLEDPSLYHYAIFSDNVLSTSVVVNSTVIHAKEPNKHVFHIVTDKLHFAAMKMWFIVHSSLGAMVHVENIDQFKWLNSSYCPVLRQLESANHPSSLSVTDKHLKYKNPKYLSVLNHLRFYMPKLYPVLDKILFLEEDVVVQKDLTPLWAIDMKGMVNGAVNTCKGSFHMFAQYLNFSNPDISKTINPHACGWAFGMNIFDLNEWKKQHITERYHFWQDLNKDRTLWKVGITPPGLLALNGRTYSLDRNWHVLQLGYNPNLRLSDIENAAVIHYNGHYKPWLDIAITKYKGYWSKFVDPDDSYLAGCNINL